MSRRPVLALLVAICGSAAIVACPKRGGDPDPGRDAAARVDGPPSAKSAPAVDASWSEGGAAVVDAGSEPGAVLARVFATHPEITTLDEVPRALPPELLRSFVLKHGRDRTGERGHLVERRISQSADPEAPRAILFDERSGLVLSYNGGLASQKNGHRLDIATFDEGTRTFALTAIDFPILRGDAPDAGRRAEPRAGDCENCHGPRRRPIFSMYPDWPGFYGSDNDELTNPRVATQVAELGDYRRFRREIAPKHPRYAPLFEERADDAKAESFPYRPDVSEDIHAISRAFAHRPGLRLGILLNRLQARMVAEHVVHHPRFDRLGVPFLASLLECRLEPASLAAVKKDVEAALGGPLKTVGGALHYRQAWKLFDLEVRDVDIRYGYEHEGYRSDDASSNPMAVGYIGTYWNSYFDGSATIDELVAHLLYQEVTKRFPDLGGLVKPNGLRRKYEHLAERYALDAAFFTAMDDKALWIPIPYPNQLNTVHHREGFGREYKDQHERLCKALATHF